MSAAQPAIWDFRIECRNLRTGTVRRLLANGDGTVTTNHADATCGDDDRDRWTPPDDHAVLVTRKDGSNRAALLTRTDEIRADGGRCLD